MKKLKSIFLGILTSILGMGVWLLIGIYTDVTVAGAEQFTLIIELVLIYVVASIITESAAGEKASNLVVDAIFSIIVAIVIVNFFEFDITLLSVQEAVESMIKPAIGSFFVIVFDAFASTPIISAVSKKD